MYDIIDIRGNHASQLLTQYLRIKDEPYAEITLYGVETSQASYLDVMRHDLRFRTEIAENETAISLLKQCIEVSERLARKLRHTMLNKHIVPEKVAEAAVEEFYAFSEKAFWKLCSSDEIAGDCLQHMYREWCSDICNGVLDAYNAAMETVNLRGKDLAKAAEQQRWLLIEIRKVKEEAQ